MKMSSMALKANDSSVFDGDAAFDEAASSVDLTETRPNRKQATKLETARPNQKRL